MNGVILETRQLTKEFEGFTAVGKVVAALFDIHNEGDISSLDIHSRAAAPGAEARAVHRARHRGPAERLRRWRRRRGIRPCRPDGARPFDADAGPGRGTAADMRTDGEAFRSASAIALATRGAKVTAAKPVPAGAVSGFATPGLPPKSHGEYCQLSIEIASVDVGAPPIKMSLSLPTDWNRKAMMYGGGGYDGTIPDPTNRSLLVSGNDRPDPIGRGYAVFASDSGHEEKTDPDNPGIFGLNEEATRNFAFEALKKTRDAAHYLIRQRYAQAPTLSYFVGGSSGGREALAVVQKWPRDFQGAIVSSGLQCGQPGLCSSVASPGRWQHPVPIRTPAKRAALFNASMHGLRWPGWSAGQGHQQPAACNRRFDPATAMLDGKPLLPGRRRYRRHLPVGCADRRVRGDQHTGGVRLPAGQRRERSTRASMPGALSSDTTRAHQAWVRPLQKARGSASFRLCHPMPGARRRLPCKFSRIMGPLLRDAGSVLRFVDAGSRAPFFFLGGGVHAGPIAELAALQDINQADLSAFRAQGGKLLDDAWHHGPAGQPTRDEPVLQPGAGHDGRGPYRRIHALLRDPGRGPWLERGLHAQLGFADGAGELGGEGRVTGCADRHGSDRRAGSHTSALQPSRPAPIQGQRRCQSGRELWGCVVE